MQGGEPQVVAEPFRSGPPGLEVGLRKVNGLDGVSHDVVQEGVTLIVVSNRASHDGREAAGSM
jgi:hypothetical protein